MRGDTDDALGLVDAAVGVVRDRAGLLVPLGLAGYGGTTAVLVVGGALGGGPALVVLGILAVPVVLVTAAAGVAGSVPDLADPPRSVLAAVRQAAPRLPALAGFVVLAVLLVAASLIGCLVVALPTAGAMAVGFAAVVLERCGAARGVRRGLQVTRLHRTRVVWAGAAALLVTAAVAAVGAQAGLAVSLVGDGGTAATVLLLVPLVVVVAGFGLPVLVALVAGAYVDCRIRTEALDLFVDLADLPAVRT